MICDTNFSCYKLTNVTKSKTYFEAASLNFFVKLFFVIIMTAHIYVASHIALGQISVSS